MKLQKFLQSKGYSRRMADKLVFDGKVYVNEKQVFEPWYEVNFGDIVQVENKNYTFDDRNQNYSYYVLHKPKGYSTTLFDPKQKNTILTLLEEKNLQHLKHLKPVGRLDKDVQGVVILTDDGDLINILTSARYGVEKVYVAKVKGKVRKEDLEKLKNGIEDSGEFLKCEDATVMEMHKDYSVVKVTMIKGKKHEVKRLLASIGNPVIELVRIKHGPVDISLVPNPGDIVEIPSGILSALLEIKAKYQDKFHS
ncbi:MAG: pseudouridine synthase [Fervidobacterium sp.]|uniref:pseudouridine synthase n=1 Tax=Fervidobacterium sp. TaxID=1871331 RepID=UPI00404A7910